MDALHASHHPLLPLVDTMIARLRCAADPRQDLIAGAGAPRMSPSAARNLAAAHAHLRASYAPGRERPKAADLGFVRTLHAIALEGLLAPEKCGAWRRTEVDIFDVRTRTLVNAGAPAREVPDAMVRWSRHFADLHRFHPCLRSGLAHLLFERIHPFAEGNGRVGRLLIEAFHLEAGLPDLPIIAVLERRRGRYHACLTDAILQGAPALWLDFYLASVVEAADMALAAAPAQAA